MYTAVSILVSVRQTEPLLLCEYTTELNKFSEKRFIVRKNPSAVWSVYNEAV